MKTFICGLLTFTLLGCGDLVSDLQTADDEGPKEAEQAPVEQLPGAADAAPAADQGARQAAADVENEAEKSDKPVHFRKRVAELVDLNEAMAANENLVDIGRNRITANDYLSAVAQGYFAAASRVQLLQMQHTIRTMQALNNRYPTYEEFKKLLSDNGIELGHLYPYQMYAYDEETGEITILEDRAKKKEHYEAAGREYPHEK